MLEECAHGCEAAAHRGGRQAAVLQGDRVVVEHAHLDLVGIDMLDEIAEIDQVAAVGLDGVRRRATLELQAGQKLGKLGVVRPHHAGWFVTSETIPSRAAYDSVQARACPLPSPIDGRQAGAATWSSGVYSRPTASATCS